MAQDITKKCVYFNSEYCKYAERKKECTTTKKLFMSLKLGAVGPVDNRPFTDMLHQFDR